MDSKIVIGIGLALGALGVAIATSGRGAPPAHPGRGTFAPAWFDGIIFAPDALASDPGLAAMPDDATLATGAWTHDPAYVRVVQRQLKTLGFYAGGSTGVFDGATDAALQAYTTEMIRRGRPGAPTLAQVLNSLALDYLNNRLAGLPSVG